MKYVQVRADIVNVPSDFNCEVCAFCKNGHCLLFDSLQDCKKAKLKDRRFDVGDIVYTNVCRWRWREAGGYRWEIAKLKIKEVIYQSKKTIRYVCEIVDTGKECVLLDSDGLTQDFELAKRDNAVLNSLQPFTRDGYKNIKTMSDIVW